MRTLRQRIRVHHVWIRNRDIAIAIGAEFGHRPASSTISGYLAGRRPWPVRYIPTLYEFLRQRGLRVSKVELVELCAQTMDEIQLIEGGD